jgi:RNA polymerase sigma-70 factor (ECF subfamily)
MMLDATLDLKNIVCEATGFPDAMVLSTNVDAMAGDRALVKRAQSGENKAFGELVTRYRRRILKVSLRYTHDPDDAEDAAQNAFLKAHRAIRQFRGDSAFYSWLCRIAINTAKTIRSNRVRDEKLFESIHTQPPGSDTAAQFLGDWTTPESLLATDDIYAVINSALCSLSEEQRSAIVLRELHELTYEDVATAMACPVGTVRSRVFRAREAIDRQLRRSLGRGLGRATDWTDTD